MQAADDNNDDNNNSDDSNNNNNHKDSSSMVAYSQALYRTHGWQVFVRGMEFSALQSATEKALYFLSYETLKAAHANTTSGARLGTLTNLLLGCAAEWMHLPLSLPIDAWTTKIQTSASQQAPLHILLTMMRDKNRMLVYKGLTAYYLLCLKPAIQYTVFEQVKTAWVAKRSVKALSAAEAFLLGMLARAIATVAVFPFLRAKVLMQTRNDNASTADNASTTANASTTSKTKHSLLDLLLQIYQTQGVKGLYQGLGPELTRGVFSAALMLMIKEQIAVAVNAAVVGRRLKQQQQLSATARR